MAIRISVCVGDWTLIFASPDARQMAFELVLTLSETASPMMRKQPNFVSTIVPLAMNWLADIDDDPSWNTSDDVSFILVDP